MNRELKRELRRSKRENKRCKKIYSDWKNDEFNCGPLKFIWGVPSNPSEPCTPSFCTLNDLEIHYNRDTKKYLLYVECVLSFTRQEETTDYLNTLLNKLKLFLVEFNEDNNKSFDAMSLSNYYTGELFIGDTVEELYYKFYIFVKGFCQL